MYIPDKWIILKIKDKKETVYKILAGWSGGYLDGQSWRINSGINKITKKGAYYLFEGDSGSVYKCHNESYGTNLISSSILSKMLENPQTKDMIEVLDNQDFTKLIK